MQPLQYDLRDPAAKDNIVYECSHSTKQPWRSHYNAICRDWVAKRNRTTRNGVGNCSSKTGWISTPERKKDDFEALFKRIFRRKITSAKMEKICWQITVAAFMQPLQYDLRSPAAKDNSITHAAKAGSNLDAATTMRSAKTELQTAIPFTLRERSYSCKAEWNSIGNSSTSNTCNPIYIAGTILQSQITMEFHRQLIHQHHLQPHLQCGNDPTVANHNGILSTAHARKTVETPFTMRNRSEHDPTTHETVSQPSHRRGRSSRFGDGLCMEKPRVSCICYLSKTHFVRDFLQNSIGNSSTSTTCNPICNAGTILQLQITMEFCRPHMHEKQLKPHLQCGADPSMIRTWSEQDPNMIRPHTRPSRNRRTAEVDHRGSETDFVWKNLGFRASAISQKRISCETSFKTPSATPPPAPLAMPF